MDIFNLSARNLINTILVAPRTDVDLSGFRRVVWLDRPHAVTLPVAARCRLIVCSDTEGGAPLGSIDGSREHMLKIFAWASANAGNLEGASAEEAAFAAESPFKVSELLFAFKVFEQLGLMSFGMRPLVYRGVKTDLNNSALYRLVAGGAQAGLV